MTKIVDGYAQADVEATKGDETIVTFVETPESLLANLEAIEKSERWLKENRPKVRVDVVLTEP